MASAVSAASTPSSASWNIYSQCDGHQASQKNPNGFAIRDALCNLRPVEIPRPKCVGFQFVSTRGRFGFYQSLARSGAEKIGFNLKAMAPSKRPSLPNEWHHSERLNGKSPEIADDTFRSPTHDLRDKPAYTIPEEPEYCSEKYQNSTENNGQTMTQMIQPVKDAPDYNNNYT